MQSNEPKGSRTPRRGKAKSSALEEGKTTQNASDDKTDNELEKPRAKARASLVDLLQDPDCSIPLNLPQRGSLEIEKSKFEERKVLEMLNLVAKKKGMNVEIRIKRDMRKARVKRTPFNVSLSNETIAQLEEFAAANRMKNREAIEFMLDVVSALETYIKERA